MPPLPDPGSALPATQRIAALSRSRRRESRRRRRAAVCCTLPRVNSGTVADADCVMQDDAGDAECLAAHSVETAGLGSDTRRMATAADSTYLPTQLGIVSRKRRHSLDESSDDAQAAADAWQGAAPPPAAHKIIFRDAEARGRRSATSGEPLDVGGGPDVVAPKDLLEWHRMNGEGTRAWGQARTADQRSEFQEAMDRMEQARDHVRS
jgi:hypothetical protein